MCEKTANNENKSDRRFSQEQYDMLKRCSDAKNMTEWNNWREANRDKDIELDGAGFGGWWLRGVDLIGPTAYLFDPNDPENTRRPNRGNAYLRKASFELADLTGARFRFAHLEDSYFGWAVLKSAALMNAYLMNAKLLFASLEGADMSNSHLQGTDAMRAVVDGRTSLWECEVDRNMNFLGVSLGTAKIDPGTKQLLEYNIRRKNWEDWYKEHKILRWLVRGFWCLSNYGISTGRIIISFFGLAFVFAFTYRLLPACVSVEGTPGNIRGFWHVFYFSVVTMTTLGFGDIAANPDSWLGQTLLMIQVILGYVLLGALVTRFAVLFTAGGPAGTFADEKTIWQRLKYLWNKGKKKR